MNYCSLAKNVSIECANTISIDSGIAAVNENSSKLKIQVLNVLRRRDSKWIIFLISCNSIVIYYLWIWTASADSVALKAYVNTIVFNVCALAVCLISIWVEQNTSRQNRRFTYSEDPSHRRDKFVHALPRYKSNGNPTSLPPLPQQQCQTKCQRSFFQDTKTESRAVAATVDFEAGETKGYLGLSSISILGLEKYEVLALLVSSCFSLITAFLVAIDTIARIGEQPFVHEGRLGLGAILGLITHFVTITVYPDAGLHHVVCKALPCPTLKGINPILGSNLISFVIVCGVYIAVHFWELHIIDTAAAIAVISLTVASMLPLSFFTASIILQKLSLHMSEQLDKCLREALIIDGVLEFRNEKFWTQSFGKLAGSLEVRIRKNADDHYVLQKVVKILTRVVSTLNVQEFRETSSNISYDVFANLPREYYVDELLQCRTTKNELKQQEEKSDLEEGEDMQKSVKIEEILNCCNASFAPVRVKQSQQIQAGYATLLRNDEDYMRPKKSYLFRQVPVTNALLLGSRRDLDDLQCSTRLYCPP